MKKLLMLLALSVLLVACGGNKEPDYTIEQLEAALNNGDDPTGKIVKVEVEEFVPDSAFGYNIQAGEHLNFVSSKNPNVKKGDQIIVEVTEVDNLLGSYIIQYKKQ